MNIEQPGQNMQSDLQSHDPKVSLVVAVAQNQVIGRDNMLPWHLPKDLAYFKRITMGFPIVMGRKTFDSIGRPLPGRCNIVVTRQQGWQAEGVRVAHSLAQALELGAAQARADGRGEIMLIGGAALFEQALPEAQRLYLTQVHADVPGDTYFPAYDRGQWVEVDREDCLADNNNPFDYSFVVYNRVS